jgi:hypothetical protein
MLDVNLSTRINAISQLAQNAGCDYGAYNGEITTWTKGDKPTEAEIDAEIIRLEKEYSDNEYARNRASEYPSLLELTVALYDTDDKSAVEAKRASVKLKYPKPE